MSEPEDRAVIAVIAPGAGEVPSALERAGLRRAAPGEKRVDVIVVVGGVSVVRALADAQGPPILALLEKADHGSAIRALDAGACGVLGQDPEPAQLLACIEALRVGLSVLPQQRREADSSGLTLRQQEILSLVVLGLSNTEIASRLYITESTVKSHLNAAFRKLKVRSRKEAVAKLLDPDSEHASGVLGLASSDAGTAYRRPSVKS